MYKCRKIKHLGALKHFKLHAIGGLIGWFVTECYRKLRFVAFRCCSGVFGRECFACRVLVTHDKVTFVTLSRQTPSASVLYQVRLRLTLPFMLVLFGRATPAGLVLSRAYTQTGMTPSLRGSRALRGWHRRCGHAGASRGITCAASLQGQA